MTARARREQVAPERHDELSFEELASSYNFRRTDDWIGIFVRLVVDELNALAPPATVVDIGSGHGIAGSAERVRAVRNAAGELWGVEPDVDAPEPAGVFDVFKRATLEASDLPPARFDLAYSFMVMEHVVDPESFMRAVRACLKPGGTYMFLTVNGRHYFALAARAARALRIDEILLRAVRGREDVSRYHYPVQYRCNVPPVIDRLAALTGFEPPEYVFLEEDGPVDYMRGPLRPAMHALRWKRSLVRRPEQLLTMIVRMRAAPA
jgi:SAM-dependent methyltransferase